MNFSLITPTPETAGTDQELPSVSYPVNSRGQADFASVMITLDHLLNKDPFHIIQKFVKSTELASEALVALMTNYYNDGKLLADPSVRAILNELDNDPLHTMALYIVPQMITDRFGGTIVQVLTSGLAFKRLVDHPSFGNGSELLAIDRLVGFIAKVASKGAFPRLTMLKLEDEPVSEAAE